MVDAVVYISSHEQAEVLVAMAVEHNVVLQPFGGGSNVSESLGSPHGTENRDRMVCAVDLSALNRVKWIDKENMMACVETGINGVALEKTLKKFGVCTGMMPDSIEFSTVGGWISTRASGMKKNVYGNIEDMLLNLKIVTPVGTFTKNDNSKRVSSGPDIVQLILGSEGNFGIITEAVFRIRKVPEVTIYDSILFRNFEDGVKFMRELGQRKIRPASVRTVDNE